MEPPKGRWRRELGEVAALAREVPLIILACMPDAAFTTSWTSLVPGAISACWRKPMPSFSRLAQPV